MKIGQRKALIGAGWTLIIVGLLVMIRYNPQDNYFEAGTAAYYQAKIAYERGDMGAKRQIYMVAKDKRITMREYNEVVWPLFLKVTKSGEDVFPLAQRLSTEEVLKCILAETAVDPDAPLPAEIE